MLYTVFLQYSRKINNKQRIAELLDDVCIIINVINNIGVMGVARLYLHLCEQVIVCLKLHMVYHMYICVTFLRSDVHVCVCFSGAFRLKAFIIRYSSAESMVSACPSTLNTASSETHPEQTCG